jgi:hypothetical protein
MGKRHEDPNDLHENVRDSEEAVDTPNAKVEGREPAAGLIGGGASGVGEMTDPRYIAPR